MLSRNVASGAFTSLAEVFHKVIRTLIFGWTCLWLESAHISGVRF